MQEKIRAVLRDLQVCNRGKLSYLAAKPQTAILSLAESLRDGNVLIKENAGFITVDNAGASPALLLAGELLIGRWQIKVTVLSPPGSLFIPADYLSALPAKACGLEIDCPPWQAGCIGLASEGALEILPVERLAAQLWPLMFARQQPYLDTCAGTGENFLAKAANGQIRVCPTVGAGEAYTISGLDFSGKALVFEDRLIHLYITRKGDQFGENTARFLCEKWAYCSQGAVGSNFGDAAAGRRD